MQGDIVSGVLLPAILAFIMFSLGLGLTPADFQRIVRQPRALLVGMLCHFVLLPLVCLLLIKTIGLTGAFAVGFMILAACPTGTTSNLLTYIARGDVALALSFTAVASVLTIFTLPLIVAWSLQHFAGSAQAVTVPVGAMMGQIFLMLGVPVALGMTARHLRPAAALKWEPLATRLATVLFILIVLAAVAKNWTLLRENFGSLAIFAITLNLAMLACGFLAARLARLSRKQSVTLGIESAVQNATLALVIASSVLKDDALAVPGAVYGVLMYGGGLLFAFALRRYAEAPEAQPVSTLRAQS
ncbi:bile acid:sodium symporter family protein [Rivibacter subsaxonicus]|uniref:BASS family bile acid:Na+ symporter n=1 Tax=Rivibacter subsaxonicus TaxID=457575 RepID=A0A4Q7VWE2_9BURK|nr:bile acid:sodium symporter family protein [Rivibacter subsaxonicus]RZU01021.1 BASS family bile acid:Na+ symporter [Rivibacter subsaxonicus]